jgi:hypothetical protein
MIGATILFSILLFRVYTNYGASYRVSIAPAVPPQICLM